MPPSGFDEVLAAACNALMLRPHGNGSRERSPRPIPRTVSWRDGFEVEPTSSVPTHVVQWTPTRTGNHTRPPDRPWAYPRARRNKIAQKKRTWSYVQVNVTAWNSGLRWHDSLLGGEWCPVVLCIHEHHITEDGPEGARNQARNVGYVGFWNAATASSDRGTKGGTAVLAWSHVSTYLWSGEGMSQRNSDIMWEVAEWLVAMGRLFVWVTSR